MQCRSEFLLVVTVPDDNPHAGDVCDVCEVKVAPSHLRDNGLGLLEPSGEASDDKVRMVLPKPRLDQIEMEAKSGAPFTVSIAGSAVAVTL
jgi:hypothetical protein